MSGLKVEIGCKMETELALFQATNQWLAEPSRKSLPDGSRFGAFGGLEPSCMQ